MQVNELIKKTGWKNVTSNPEVNNTIDGAFVGDLLSFVMGNGDTDNVWVTIQAHINVVAVAVLREFSCVIVCEGIEIDESVISKAKEEELVLISCSLPIYQCVEKLIEIGI
jgi:hypothetical protein